MNNLRKEPAVATTSKVEEMEAMLLNKPQIEAPLKHRFEKGVYIREILMPRESVIIGHQHKTKHWNIVLTGKAIVMMDGVRHEIVAPCCFESNPGVRKVLLILEDMIWQTVHVTNETNLAKLEDELIVKSASYLDHQRNLADAGNLVDVERSKACLS